MRRAFPLRVAGVLLLGALLVGISTTSALAPPSATSVSSFASPRSAHASGSAPTYVILVHGYDPSTIPATSVWTYGVDFELQLEKAGYVVGVVSYYGTFTLSFSNGTVLTDPSYFGTTETPIESVATELGAMLHRAFGGRSVNVDFLAHSMGGLVTLYMLEHVSLPGVHVENVVFLASPLDGAPVTYLTPYLNLSGYEAAEMSEGSPFLQTLHAWVPTARSNHPATEWLVYAGDADPYWANSYFGAPNDGFVDDPSAEDFPYDYAFVFPDLHVPELDVYTPGSVSYFEDQNVANELLANFAGQY